MELNKLADRVEANLRWNEDESVNNKLRKITKFKIDRLFDGTYCLGSPENYVYACFPLCYTITTVEDANRVAEILLERFSKLEAVDTGFRCCMWNMGELSK